MVELTWSSAADWDNAQSESQVVHDSFGDHTDDTLELGYPTTDQNGSNLLAYLSLDESSGTLVDVTGNGNDGGVNGGLFDQTGILNTTSVSLDGGNDYIDISRAHRDFQTFSASGWFYVDQFQGYNFGSCFFGFDSPDFGNDSEWAYNSNNNVWRCSIRSNTDTEGGNQVEIPDSNVPTGEWIHVVFSLDIPGSNFEVFVNGVSSGSVSISTVTEFDTSNFYIGHDSAVYGEGDFLDARVDEVRYYDRALDSTDASRLYNTISSGSLTTGVKTS